MINWGNVPLGSVIPVPFDTFASATGASITMSGLAVTDIEVYKGTSMTQRASDAGYVLMDTDGIDLDGTTGIQGFSIDTGDNTDAGFFVAGSFFWVVVSAITVDGNTVNFLAATFRLVVADNTAGTPVVDVGRWLGTAAATPTVAGVPEVDVTHWLGTAAATPTVAGVPEVDVTHFGGTAATASGGRPEVNTTHAAGTAWNSGAIGPSTLAADTIGASELAADAVTEIVNGVLAGVIETGYTVKNSLSLILSSVCCILSGAATTTITTRDPNNAADRLVATVDANGNRSAVTLTPN